MNLTFRKLEFNTIYKTYSNPHSSNYMSILSCEKSSCTLCLSKLNLPTFKEGRRGAYLGLEFGKPTYTIFAGSLKVDLSLR